MATVTNKRKVLNNEEKFSSDTRKEHVGGGADVCRDFSLVNFLIQTICKNTTIITIAFEQNALRIQQF